MDVVKSSQNEIWIKEMVVPDEIIFDGGAATDITNFQVAKHYSLITIHQRFKPQLSKVEWCLELSNV